jgi:hypothetical protein
MGISYGYNKFWSATNLCLRYATSLNSYFKFRHHAANCSRGTKKRLADKKVSFIFVLIPWYPISYLTIASSVFFFWALTGPFPTLRFGGACGRGVGAFDRGKNLDFSRSTIPTVGFYEKYGVFGKTPYFS